MKAFRSILATFLFCIVSVGYSQENNRPVVSANLPTIQISEGGTSTEINLLDYVSDADVDNPDIIQSLSFEIVSSGNFQSNTDTALSGSSFTYAHNGAESISDEISFTVSDLDENGSTLSTESFSLTVQITAVNDSPSLPDQSISVDEGDQASANIGATDPESNTLVYTISSQASNGEVILTGSTYTYVHNGGESTSDTFQITATEVDDSSKSVTGTFTVAVSALNDSPQALDLSGTVLEGSSTSFSFSFDEQLTAGTVSFFDPDTDPNDVTIRVSSTPSNGTASVLGTELSYTHNGSETTTDSFTYEVFDGSLSSEYTVSLTVTPQNDAPVAAADTYFISSDDASISISANTGVLQNDSDAENDALTVTILEVPSSGSVTLNEDGSFVYEVVTAGFNTDTFTYTLSDANGSQSTAEVTIELSDLKPVPESYELSEGETLSIDDANGVLGNDSDSNNLEINSVLVTEPNHGTITLLTDGSFIYEHDGSENRSDQFTYKLENANGDESKATFVNLNISNVNDAPTANNTSITLNEGTSITFSPNYEDLDNEFSELTFEVSTPESGNTGSGVLTIDENGQLNFTHGGSEITSDLFTYTVSDGEFTSDPANIRITILPVNDAPVIDATDLAITVDEGGSITKSVTVTDAEQDSTSLLQVSGGEASYGSVQIDGTSIIYTHDGSTNFSDSFVLRSYDGSTFGSNVTFTVAINEVNDAPILKSGATTSYSLDEGASSTISLTNLFTDEEGDSITVSVTSATNGSLTDQGDGSYTYQHDGSETLTDSFTVTASDGVSESQTTQKISLTISPVNDAPTIGGITDLEVDQLDELIITPTISDPDNTTFTLSISNKSGSGEIEDNGDGTFTYIDATDDSNFSEGVQSTNFTFDLTVSDGTNSVVENVSIEVDNIDETLPQVVLRSNDTNLEEGETGTIFVSLVDNTFYSKKRDLPSQYLEPYFEYVGQFNGHTYYYYKGGLENYNGVSHSYSNASYIASLVGGYPVVVESAAEENFLMGNDIDNPTEFDISNKPIWMGYIYNFETKVFDWINGSNSDKDTQDEDGNTISGYTNWRTGSGTTYPNNPTGQPVGVLGNGNGWVNFSDDNGAHLLVEFDKLAILDEAITLNITAGGDATDTDDYATVASTVTIPANSTSEVQIDVVVVDDTDDETGETLTFTASAESNDTFYIKRSQSSLSFTINDNDDTTAGFTIGSETASGQSLSESQGEVTLTMSIANPKTYETSLLFDISGEATEGEDYQAKNIGYVDNFLSDIGEVRAFAQSKVDGKIYFSSNNRLIKTYDSTNGDQDLNANTGWGSHTIIPTDLDNVRFRYIRDFDIDDNGNLYVIDDNYIRKINTSTGLVTFVAGASQWSENPVDGKGINSKFSDPREIATSADGSVLFVFDRQRVRKITFDDDGSADVVTIAGTNDWGHQDGNGTSARFADVQDIKVDPNGDLILIDNQRIRKVSGSEVTTIKQLNRNLHGLDIDSSGDYYLSARWANQLYKYDVSEDIVRTLIDSDGDGGTVNGPISEAKISSPQDVLLTSAGELLFAEPGNSQIRKIDFINKIRVKAGETTGDYVLTLTDDNFYENEETIVLTPSSADGINISGLDPITLTLTSDDSLPEVQVNAANSTINEDAGAFVFTVSLGNAAEASAKNDLDPAYLNQFKYLGEFDGSKYYVSQNYYNWNDANNTAQSVGANLVVINNQEENDFIKNNIPNYSNSVWIGYNDKSQEGRFEWSSGSNSDFENWQNGEPNNAGDEDYVELMNNGKWNDLPQWSNLPFVVEFSGVKSSIDTRVTLQVDDSTSATPDSDFTAPESLIVTIPAGEDSATLSFTVTDDSENEAAEFINLTIIDINDADGNPTGIISSTNGSASVEILDNEANVVTLSTSGSELNESNSSVIISVSSNIAKQVETSVVLAVNQGDSDTAVQNKDYYIPELDKIKTIAGSTRGYTDGIASEANFNNNWKMTVFGDQGYLIADRDNHVIRLLDKSGNVSTYVGNGNYRGNDNQNGVDRLEARLSGPSDIAVNSSGEIFIVEQYSNAISKIDTDGNYQIVANEYGNWGSEDNDDAKQATFNNPRAIAFDSQGNLYVADGEHRIRKLTFSGNNASVETYAGNGEWGENNGDRSDARFSDPKDIIVDAQDNLYIAEHNRIRKINAQGIVSTLAGSWWGENDGSLTSARFRNPTALAFDSSGNILVTDDDHNSLRIIYLKGDKAGQVQTLIGGNGSGFEDGAFADAKLKRPRGVVADATRILVSDTENNRIREISLEPTIVIPAGELSGSITLLPIDDDVFELDESISLNLSSSSNVDLANSDLTAIDVNLVSDDVAPTVRISANKSTLDEDGGVVTVSLRLSDQFSSAKADMEESLKSNYYYLGEYNGSKYYASKSNQWYQYNEAKRVAENLGGTLAIINTQQENDFITQRIFDLDPNYSANDNRWLNHWIGYEYNQENESWEWNNGQNIQFANWQGDNYIRNPEGRPVARLHENGQWDNGEKNWGNQFVIEYSGAYSDVATNAGISFQLSGGAEASDYSSSASETITIAAGEYKGEFTITGLNDDLDEGIETILVSLVEGSTDATIDTNNSSVQIQIADDDLTTVTMSTDAGESISESDGAYSIIAELTNEKTYPVTVDLSFDNTTEGAAVFGLDFDSPSLNKTSTLAGTGNYGFVNGDASIAQFESDIRSMVTDKSGNLYIADSNRSVIRKFDKATNSVSTYVGNPNGGSDKNEGNRSDVRVGFIRAMASDTLNNRLYFWDDWTRLVRRVNLETGKVSFVAGDGSGNGSDGSAFEASFQNISAMTLGADGDIYFIDNTQLKKITISEGADAIVSTLAGEYNNGGFNDGFGNEVRISWADQKGMALDLDGNIVFTDGNQHRVRKYNVSTGEVTTIAGQWWDYADGVGTNARFKNPIGLAISANGDIYVADAEDKRIRKIVKQDNGSYLVSTVAGNGNNGYADGEASSSQFGNPLHLSTFGNQIAVFDQGNAVIRQIQLTPTITISAGQKSGTFQVTAIDDVVYETNEQIIVSATPTGANLLGDSSFATTLTSDDNIPIVALEASNTVVKENGGSLEVQLTLLDQEGAEVIWARNDLADETKQSFNFLGEFDGHKYYQSFNEVTFDEALSVALSLGGQLLVLDSQQENEFIGRTIRNGSWLGITDSNSEGEWTPLYGDSTYQNFDSNNNEPNGGTNENYAVTWGNQWYDVNSGNRHSFIIEFGPTKASGLDTVITLAVAGTASSEAQGEDVADFTLSSQQVTIPAGSNSATLTIATGNDSIDESIETIELSIAEIATLNDEAVATISQSKNSLVVEIDDDEDPSVSFVLSSDSLAENEGSTTVTATLSNPKVSATEVRFAFAGEATFLDDYRSSDLGKVETIAGVLKGAGFVNGSSDIARFSNIWGMVPYRDGTYLLSDFDNNTIRKLNSDGSVENFIGNGNGWGNEVGLRSSVSINRPTYVSVDDNYNVYFASQSNKVYKYNVETDRVSIIAGSGQWGYADGVGQAAQFRNPFDLEVNGDGSIIYVVDHDNGTVRKLTLGDDGQYTVSSLLPGSNNGNNQQITGSFEDAYLGRAHELEVDWENNKIYTLGNIDWGYAAISVLDLNNSTLSSTIIGTDNSWGRYWGFDRDNDGDFYLTDAIDRSILTMNVENPNTSRYSDEDTGWMFQSHRSDIFKFYRLLEDPTIIEAVVEYDFSGGSTIRRDGLEQGTTYGVQSNNTVITDTSDYFQHFEPGVYKIQINTGNLTYSISKTSDIPTRGFTSSILAGGTKGYADGTGSEAQFQNPTSILVDGSKALVYDDQNELLRSVRVKTAIIIDGRSTSGSVDFTAYKDQYFEGEEVIELSIAGIQNGVSETSVFDPITITDATFLTRVTEAPFEGVQDGKVSWGDYDRDGDMDLLLMGSGVDGTITNIYRNNNGVFVNTNQNFTKYLGGDAEFVDVDQDGWLDVALSGNSQIGRVSELYINRGSDSPSAPFFQLSTNYVVEGLSQSDMEWGDLDNDGDPDLIISGINDENQYKTLYYTNLGNYIFLQEEFFYATGRIQAEIDMFDSDNDGDLDVGISGIGEGDNFGYEFYTNSYYDATQNYDANYNFNNYRWLRDGKTMFLDLDVDSRMDYFAMGLDENRNTQQVSNLGVSLTPLNNPDFAFADYNNDGLNDVVITGEDEQGNPVTKLYVTLGGVEFGYRLFETDVDLVALRESTVDWIDYDLDGDLDLFMTGIDDSGVPVSVLYEANNVANLNEAPAKVTNLTAVHAGNGLVQLDWDKPTDNANSEFRYALRVGTSPGAADVLYVNATGTGTRLIDEPALSTLNSRELILNPGTYYAAVQAIDAGNRGGAFSDEIQFNVDYAWKRLNLGGIIDRSLRPASGSQIEFVDYDGDGDMDLIGSNVRTDYTYGGAINIFGFENGVFVPKQQEGGGSTTFGLGDLNKNGAIDIVYAQEEQSGSRIHSMFNMQPIILERIANGEDISFMSPFQNSNNFNGDNLIPSLYDAKVAIKDLDNDGMPEVILAGASSQIESEATAAVYLLRMNLYEGETDLGFNNFYFTYEKLIENNAALEGLSFLSFDLGDVDGDADYDLLFTGFGFDGYETILFENTGDLNGELFVETNNNFIAVREGSASFIDIDGDGLLDVVFTGQSGDGDTFRVYKNTGNIQNFAALEVGLPAIRKSNVDFGDFNEDGYYDILYSGTIQGEGRTTRLAEFNPSTRLFEDSEFDVSGYLDANVGFGDFDGDGDLDFVLSGEDANNDSGQIQQIADIFINVRDLATAQNSRISLAKEGNNSGIGAPTISTARRRRIEQNSYEVTVEWGGAKNKEGNPDSALTYELKVGTSKNGTEILSTVANSDGVRAIATTGNAESNKSWKLNLPEGTYFAQVQAVDASYQGSAFSEIFEFAVVNSFKLGDANGDDVVNVLDLTTNIEFIMTNVEPTAFVPEVADVNLDGVINVTDISGIVDIILNPETSTSRIALSKAVDRSDYFSNEVVGDAELALQNGAVKLRSDREVVALQFSVNKDAAIRLNDRLTSNFNVVSFERDNRMHYLVYSLNNENILGVTDQLFTVSGNTKLDVNDLAANASGVGTLSIEFVDESYLDQYNNGAVFYPNPARDVASLYVGLENAVRVQVELFNMQGTPVLQYATERNVDQINLNVSNLSSGLYAARIQITTEDGRTVTRSLKLVIQ